MGGHESTLILNCISPKIQDYTMYSITLQTTLFFYIIMLLWPTRNSANFIVEHKDNWIKMQGIIRRIDICWFFWHTFSSSLSWLLPRDKDLRSSRASRPSKTVILLLYKERSTSLVNVLKFSIFPIWLNERSATISSDLSSIQSSSLTVSKLQTPHQCSRWVKVSMHPAKSWIFYMFERLIYH